MKLNYKSGDVIKLENGRIGIIFETDGNQTFRQYNIKLFDTRDTIWRHEYDIAFKIDDKCIEEYLTFKILK